MIVLEAAWLLFLVALILRLPSATPPWSGQGNVRGGANQQQDFRAKNVQTTIACGIMPAIERLRSVRRSHLEAEEPYDFAVKGRRDGLSLP
jgi:hypothetical protein